MKKKVFIALKMAGVAGQNKLAGIFRYLSERYPDDSPWDVTLVRTREELTRELVEKAVSSGTDGFIVSIPETEESVVPLADIATPTIVMDIRSSPLERRERNLVTIRNSGEKIGYAAAQYFMGQGVARSYAFLHSEGMLDSMMHGEGPNSCVLFADIKEVVRRESTCELSGAGRLVQKAVVYIDRHALEGIGVEDVVRHLKCSRRLADLRFRELQKRSILQAITERRLDEVKRRLRETREKIDAIAASCGYSNPTYLKNLFKKRFAMTMNAFRHAAGERKPSPFLV